MYQISNEKFGLFVTELRKEKNLTQKDLAEKLYVSDKTVSKWERGLSMPNVVLLIPIADAVKSSEIGMNVGNKASIVGSDSFYLGKCIFFQFYCFFRFGFKSCLKIQ